MKGGGNEDLITELQTTSENIKEPSELQSDIKFNENDENNNENVEEIKQVFIENNKSGGNSDVSPSIDENPTTDLKDIQREFEDINIDELNNEISDNETLENNSSNEFKIIDLDNENINDKML